MKSNLHVGMAKRFCNTVRYIDDLLANKKFKEEIVNIHVYPPELTLKIRCMSTDVKGEE